MQGKLLLLLLLLLWPHLCGGANHTWQSPGWLSCCWAQVVCKRDKQGLQGL